jgi:hypothetical protein
LEVQSLDAIDYSSGELYLFLLKDIGRPIDAFGRDKILIADDETFEALIR